MSNKLLKSIRWSITYIIFVLVIVCVLAVWTAYDRILEFESSHQKIAKSTVSTLANEISELIDSQQLLLRLFVKREKQLIHSLAQFPESENLKFELTERLNEFFPDYFAFTITDHDGNPYMDDFDGFVGDLCVNDIKEHAKGKPHQVRLHPNTYFYHIDFMVPWGHKKGEVVKEKNKGGIFFVSFKPNFVARLLKLSSPPRHELRLINTKTKNLIEITEIGSRIKLKRDDFRLTKEEQQRTLYSEDVKNTFWALTDFQEKFLFTGYRNDIIKASLIILFIFIISGVVVIMLLLRSERRRVNAEQTKEEMFSLFNHDLRTPLVSIYGFLDMIAETTICEKNPEKCKTLAANAFENAEMMRLIINDILDIQKMELGEMSLEFEKVNLISLVEKVINLNVQYGQMHHVDLEMDCKVSELYIKADATKMIQAITNLLSNAIKYSPEHETVKVGVEVDDDKVTITVSDKGPGIDKDFQALVFNKFAQSKSKLTRKIEGTGLGLAIVKHIVEGHKGKVTFDTEINKGTTFKIWLPG